MIINRKSKPLIIAHRGASNIYPENTLKAFQKAIDLNADYIEFDVRRTKDREIVIIHDKSTIRTTHKVGWINRMTLREIKELDTGEGEKIPTLHELIETTNGKINYMCEIKSKGIAKQVVKIFKDLKINDTTIFISFKHKELLKIKDEFPDLKLGAIVPKGFGWITNWSSKKKIIKSAKENRFYSINPFYRLVNKRFVKLAHKNELKVFPWTVNSIKKMKKLIELGVDGILTNNILRFKEVLKNY